MKTALVHMRYVDIDGAKLVPRPGIEKNGLFSWAQMTCFP